MCSRWGQLDTFSIALPSSVNTAWILSSYDQDLHRVYQHVTNVNEFGRSRWNGVRGRWIGVSKYFSSARPCTVGLGTWQTRPSLLSRMFLLSLYKKLSYRWQSARRICAILQRCGWTAKTRTYPYVLYNDEFDRSTPKDVNINTGNQKIESAWAPPPSDERRG